MAQNSNKRSNESSKSKSQSQSQVKSQPQKPSTEFAKEICPKEKKANKCK